MAISGYKNKKAKSELLKSKSIHRGFSKEGEVKKEKSEE
jgi:hypothetical protein